MECNKEEAVRAKGIAEKKMENNDFAGAHKIAVKAQRLCPELENISQIICVCDVHCSAEKKKIGNERDWYDILKVEQSADAVSIKKQYRKLALLLHPDKNKFAGAEAAFMLIGEAQKVLLDKEKRSSFDARYRKFCQNTAPNPPPPENMNAKHVKPTSGPKPPSGPNNMTKNGSSHMKKQPQQQAHHVVSGEADTFWTVCPFCTVKYRYLKIALNKNLTCQSCHKCFIAYDMCVRSTTPGSNANQSDTCAQASKGRFQANSGQQQSGSNATQAGAGARGGVSNHGGSSNADNGRFQGNPGQQKSGGDSFAKSGPSTEVGKSNKANGPNTGTKNRTSSGGSNHSRMNIDKKEKKQATVDHLRMNIDKKEKKQATVEKEGGAVGKAEKKQRVDSLAKSAGSVQSKGSTGRKDAAVEKERGASAGSQSKRHVSDTEIGNDDETLNSSKRCKGNAQSSSPTRKSPPKVGSTNFTKIPGSTDEIDRSAKEKRKENDCLRESDHQRSCKIDKSDSSLDASTKILVEEVPDSDFSDFEQIRKKCNFKVNQIWSAYDTLDAMPRYYAHIKKVYSPGFKLRITWLEPDPDEKDALSWADNNLPFSCGKFMHGSSETTEDLLMFSQPMCWEKGNGRGCIKIYPKKDETWALLSDWHMDWMSNPHNHKKFEYEFVEVLSDYDESVGTRVAFLGKLKGFSCLFCRNGRDEIQISPSEYLRFSHRVPSYKMTGEEREGVPKGSFELDPASMPINLEEIPLPEEMNLGMATGNSSISDSGLHGGNADVLVKGKKSGFQNDKLQSISDDVAEDLTNEGSTLEACELPEPEFFNFDATRDLGRFQVGQVWALYSDTDGLPKYYGQIRKVDQDSQIKLKIAWLEACALKNDLNMWRNKDMPICCGKFKIKNPKLQSYLDSSPFSHQLQAKTLKKSVFEIYPQKGEIWAMYKNWNVDMTPSDLENCDYDFVEILESVKGSSTKVLILEHVADYKSVFKSKKSGSSFSTMEIPYNDLLKFSHQIPAHILTEEKGGALKGFKELDPSALPASFFLPKVR